ncbi:polysaccharide deacetylase family protein [Bacillus sp. PS06]|uniref:polysaccharide deacetylase family protein n=1 Tax=Bacillus sp. PS06 TaxID=2764176 RepID=UPI0017800BFD|nr:polysaccharide deacetylase family protein [Bacillus sp. PS06]MBD8068252.1 polysaccharide deacetylase family protein [Bacillus sp. PS06]
MKRSYIHFISFLFIFIISVSTIQNPYTTNYIGDLKDDSVTVSKQVNSLYQEIVDKASEYEVAPIDAEINKVWKATPGYNGIQVDVDASYKKMKKEGNFDEQHLVLKQVSPKVHLDDLPPEAIYRGNPDKPMVSFLINVAWGNEYIPDMLDTLEKHHVKATFFLEGRWVNENPDLAKMIVSAGHEVGNHSYTHPNLKTMPSSSVVEQLAKTNDVIEATTGKKPTLFAPPSGNYRDEVVKIAAEQGMKTIMWSVDTIDWQRPTPDVLVQRVMSKVHPGALILMHPTSSTSQALETLIVSIKQKEYIINNVSTLLSEERVMK